MVGNDLSTNARIPVSFLGESSPQRVGETARGGYSKQGLGSCDPGGAGPCGCPWGSGCGRSPEPALAQTMIQPTGRIISEELLDTMRKTFPNKAFSAPPASLPQPGSCSGVTSGLRSPQQQSVFLFSPSQGERSWAQRAQDPILAPRSNTEAANKAPGHVQLQPAISWLQTSGAGKPKIYEPGSLRNP